MFLSSLLAVFGLPVPRPVFNWTSQIAKPAEILNRVCYQCLITKKQQILHKVCNIDQTMAPNCHQNSDKTCWTFCASILASKIKQNLLIEPDGRLAHTHTHTHARTHTHTHTRARARARAKCKSDWATFTRFTSDNANFGGFVHFESHNSESFEKKRFVTNVLETYQRQL